MKAILHKINFSAVILACLGAGAAVTLSSCASGEGAGKIGPDYDSPQMKQLQMQEAQSRVTRSLIR